MSDNLRIPKFKGKPSRWLGKERPKLTNNAEYLRLVGDIADENGYALHEGIFDKDNPPKNVDLSPGVEPGTDGYDLLSEASDDLYAMIGRYGWRAVGFAYAIATKYAVTAFVNKTCGNNPDDPDETDSYLKSLGVDRDAILPIKSALISGMRDWVDVHNDIIQCLCSNPLICAAPVERLLGTDALDCHIASTTDAPCTCPACTMKRKILEALRGAVPDAQINIMDVSDMSCESDDDKKEDGK